jgi:hypothetical protein
MNRRAVRVMLLALGLVLLASPLLQAGRGTAQQASESADLVRLYFYRDERIGVAIREESRLIVDTSIYFATLVELIRGPQDAELGAGLSTLLPRDLSVLSSVILEDGVATVNFSSQLTTHSESGQPLPAAMIARRMAQVVFTLTQFGEIRSVNFQVDGVAIDALDSDGASVFRPVTREDYASLTPAILVESPGVWERLTSPIRIAGTANTFEANVQYRITDARGTSVAEGFFSASSGSGVRGVFDESIDFDVIRQGRATLVVFEQSAMDGSEINIIAIPIEIVRGDEPTPTSPPIVQTSPTPGTPEPSATSTAEGTPTGEATATVTTEPPTATAEPPTATTEPPTATTEPPTATVEPTTPSLTPTTAP